MNVYKKINGYAVTNVGLVRDNNEDNFLLGHCLNEKSQNHMSAGFCEDVSNWSCIAVFDGMGGIECGEVASYTAASTFQEIFLDHINCDRSKIDRLIEDAFLSANTAIKNLSVENIVCGTTGTVAITNGVEFKIFHKGDSRAYLFRAGKLYKLSKDHTLAQLKVDVGIYSSITDAPEKENHQLVEYLGMDDESSEPYESEWIKWEKEDRLLICSDGLYDMCRDEDILQVISQINSIQENAEALVKLALKNGGKDNVTILITEVV